MLHEQRLALEVNQDDDHQYFWFCARGTTEDLRWQEFQKSLVAFQR